MLTLANSMGIATETIGFCESFLDMLIHFVPGFTSIANDGRTNDLRLLGVILLVLLFFLAIGGMNVISKVQLLLLVWDNLNLKKLIIMQITAFCLQSLSSEERREFRKNNTDCVQ